MVERRRGIVRRSGFYCAHDFLQIRRALAAFKQIQEFSDFFVECKHSFKIIFWLSPSFLTVKADICTAGLSGKIFKVRFYFFQSPVNDHRDIAFGKAGDLRYFTV